MAMEATWRMAMLSGTWNQKSQIYISLNNTNVSIVALSRQPKSATEDFSPTSHIITCLLYFWSEHVSRVSVINCNAWKVTHPLHGHQPPRWLLKLSKFQLGCVFYFIYLLLTRFFSLGWPFTMQWKGVFHARRCYSFISYWSRDSWLWREGNSAQQQSCW